MQEGVLRLASHLRKYLLLYVLLDIAVAVPLGYHYAWFFKAHAQQVKITILSLAVATLYPSMIQLRAEKMGAEFRFKAKEVAVGLLLVFLIAPLAAMFSAGYIGHREIGIGFVAANAVPASSASIAYVMLAEGNVELATVLAILSIIGAIIAAPLYVGLYASSVSVNVPVSLLAESVTIALVTPFILGQLTRYYLVKRKARIVLGDKGVRLPCKEIPFIDGGIEEFLRHLEEALECIEGRISRRLKPYLSLATMVFMLLLIFTLIANKAGLLVKKPVLAADIIGAQLIIYGVIIALLLALSRLIRIRYEDHMGIAFIAITKNESVAAAMAVMAIGPAAALPAALVPTIQPVVAIAYIAAAPIIHRLLVKDRG